MQRADHQLLKGLGSLLLRPWDAQDARNLVEAFADPDIRRWHVNVVDGREEALEWIDSWRCRWQAETDACWAVVDDLTDNLLGRVALRGIDLGAGKAECSYWVVPEARRRGVAVGGTTRLASWAMDELGLHRLTVVHSVANEGSCRVGVRAGFTLEGTMASEQLLVDGWHDTHLHARTA